MKYLIFSIIFKFVHFYLFGSRNCVYNYCKLHIGLHNRTTVKIPCIPLIPYDDGFLSRFVHLQ